MSKPTNKPGWTSTTNPTSEPTTKKLTGWSAGEKPSAEHMNWLFQNISEWINHVDVDQVKGETGDQGPQGVQGAQGAQGIQGENGAIGLKGQTGDQGAQGDQGAVGPNGLTGDQGIQGLKGDKGDVGETGAIGPKGDIGAQGPVGLKGLTGDQGIQGLKGLTGDQGAIGLKGLTGDQGVQGLQGAKGATGNQGAVGSKGLTGDQGPQGVAGSSTLDATTSARITTLESKAHIATPSSVSMTLSYQETGVTSEYDNGTKFGLTTINWLNGVCQAVTVNGATNFSLSNPTSGKVYYLKIKGLSLSNLFFPANVSFQNGSVTSVSGGYTCILSLYYNGSQYLTQSITSLFSPVSGTETKNGYVAGGNAASSAVSSVEKINFNNDSACVIVQDSFGKEFNSTGSYTNGSGSAVINYSQGTQSSVYGYRAYQNYGSLPSVNNNNVMRTHKLAFANDTGVILTLVPANTTGWYSCSRRPITQSTSAAYQVASSSSISKLLFSTDVFSSVSFTTTSIIVTSLGCGFSNDTTGYNWYATGDVKITFSNEAVSSVTGGTFSNDGGGWGEAIDGSSSGYYQRTTATTPTATTFKFNKATEGFTTLGTTLSTTGGASSATQGSTNGYFCGGTRVTTSPLTSDSTFANIRKINMSTDTVSINGGSLKTARSFAAGFEG